MKQESWSIITSDLEEVYNRGIPWKNLRNKTVFVSGAYGMLASYVVYMLIYLNEKHDMNIHILAQGRSREKFMQRYQELAKKTYLEYCADDINCELELTRKVDFIIHAASLASPQFYSTCPIEVLEPNVLGTYHLLKLAEKNAVEGFLLFSSGDVYGLVTGADSISESDYGKMDTLDIHNCYSESKRMAETMCRAWQQQKRTPVKIARIWHTYSPTMDIANDARVFASFVNDIFHDRDIVVKSDGKSKRSFCYIADAIAALFLILFSGKDAEAYNVCNTDEYYSISELANLLTQIRHDKNLKVVFKERSVTENYVENPIVGFIPPSNKKLRALGWECKYSVKEGFTRVLDFLSMTEGKKV